MKALVLALAVFTIVSCSPFGFNKVGYESPRMELPEAWMKTARHTYIDEGDHRDYWKSPKEFEADDGGDCEDFSGYMLYLLGEGEAICVKYTRDGIDHYHCIIKYNGKYLEPQRYGRYYDIEEEQFTIYKIISWDIVMSYITLYGIKDL